MGGDTIRTVSTPNPHRDKDDRTTLYGLAANCSLYEEDDQPSQLNVGSEYEPRMVNVAEAWRDFYARTLVDNLSADTTRIAAVGAWALDRRPTAAASVSGSDVFGQDEWDLAIELCDRATAIIEGAGATEDEFARQRLLAAIAHSLQADTFGAIPGVTERSAADLLAELDRIDQHEQDG